MVKQYDPRGASAELQWSAALPFDSGDRGTSGAGADVTVTITADAARPIILTQIHCSYSAAPTGGQLIVKDGSTVVFQQYLSGAGPYEFNFSPPRTASQNAALAVTLKGGGGAIIGELDVNCHKLA